jgi:hypothetical protein
LVDVQKFRVRNGSDLDRLLNVPAVQVEEISPGADGSGQNRDCAAVVPVELLRVPRSRNGERKIVKPEACDSAGEISERPNAHRVKLRVIRRTLNEDLARAKRGIAGNKRRTQGGTSERGNHAIVQYQVNRHVVSEQARIVSGGRRNVVASNRERSRRRRAGRGRIVPFIPQLERRKLPRATQVEEHESLALIWRRLIRTNTDVAPRHHVVANQDVRLVHELTAAHGTDGLGVEVLGSNRWILRRRQVRNQPGSLRHVPPEPAHSSDPRVRIHVLWRHDQREQHLTPLERIHRRTLDLACATSERSSARLVTNLLHQSGSTRIRAIHAGHTQLLSDSPTRFSTRRPQSTHLP